MTGWSVVTGPDGQQIVTSYEGEVSIRGAGDRVTAGGGARLLVPLGAILMVKDGEEVKRDQVIFSWDPYTNPIITDVGGAIRFVDLVEDESVSEELDELTGLRQRVVIEDRDKKLHPHIEIWDEKGDRKVRDFVIPVGAQLTVDDGAKISAGTIISEGEPGSVQDPGHHGWSAACRRAVRGTAAEGSGDDFGDRRCRAVRRDQARQA